MATDPDEVVARAIAAARRGFGRHADSVLRHAVHGDGLRPIELILAALAAPSDTVHLPTRESPPMKVSYAGPSTTGVKVVHPAPGMPDATTVTVCLPGESVDLPDEQARTLVAAGSFEPVAEDRPKARKSSTTTDKQGEG